MVRRTRPQMCNCTSGNLEIPGSRFARPGMTEQLSVALAPTTRAPAPSAFPASAGFAARRDLLRRSRAQTLAGGFFGWPALPAPPRTAAARPERGLLPRGFLLPFPADPPPGP